MNALYGLMALAAGVGMAAQAAINSRLSAGIGGQPLLASLISFAIGTLCLAAVALFQADWQVAFAHAGQQPWWRWLGGALGAAFVFTSVFLVPRIGIANAVFLFIIGQLVAGMAIDSFGLLQMAPRPVHWWKFAGLGTMGAGLVIFMFGDRLFAAA